MKLGGLKKNGAQEIKDSRIFGGLLLVRTCDLFFLCLRNI